MGEKRSFTPSKKRVRNLAQYRNMADEEFDLEYERLYGADDVGIEQDDLETLIKVKIDALGEDYDFEDMKVNDMAQLRAFAMALIQLDDLEMEAFEVRKSITSDNIFVLEKIHQHHHGRQRRAVRRRHSAT